MPKTTYELREKDDLWKITTQDLSPKMRGIVHDKVWNHIRTNPYNSEYLRLKLEGLRSYKMPSGDRIIFAICKECRKNGFESVNNCSNCEEIADNTVVLFVFGSHDIYDWLGKKREKAWKKAKKKKRRSRKRRY